MAGERVFPCVSHQSVFCSLSATIYDYIFFLSFFYLSYLFFTFLLHAGHALFKTVPFSLQNYVSMVSIGCLSKLPKPPSYGLSEVNFRSQHWSTEFECPLICIKSPCTLSFSQTVNI